MPRRPPSKVPKGIPRARKLKRQRKRGRAVYAPLTPWVGHALKRPRTA